MQDSSPEFQYHISWVFSQQRLKLTYRQVLMAIVFTARGRREVNVSVPLLAQHAEVAEHIVRAAIDECVRIGLLANQSTWYNRTQRMWVRTFEILCPDVPPTGDEGSPFNNDEEPT